MWENTIDESQYAFPLQTALLTRLDLKKSYYKENREIQILTCCIL